MHTAPHPTRTAVGRLFKGLIKKRTCAPAAPRSDRHVGRTPGAPLWSGSLAVRSGSLAVTHVAHQGRTVRPHSRKALTHGGLAVRSPRPLCVKSALANGFSRVTAPWRTVGRTLKAPCVRRPLLSTLGVRPRIKPDNQWRNRQSHRWARQRRHVSPPVAGGTGTAGKLRCAVHFLLLFKRLYGPWGSAGATVPAGPCF